MAEDKDAKPLLSQRLPLIILAKALEHQAASLKGEDKRSKHHSAMKAREAAMRLPARLR